jgi:tetratricopeptide (TPR) repeat protein
MSALDQQLEMLKQRMAATSLSSADINAATDFAIDANAAGRADLTLALLEPLALRVSDHAKIWQLIGLAHRDEQDMAKAHSAFDWAVNLAPQDPRIALGKAQIAFECGTPAAAQFQKIRQIAPQDGELALSTAAALFHEGDAEAAITLVADLVAQNPGWLRGHDWLGKTRWMLGETADFARSFVQAVTAHPDDPALRIGWFRAVSQTGQWEAADRIIEDARSRIGARTEFDAAEAQVATESADDERAERLFATVESVQDPGVALAHIRHCLRTGQYDKAQRIGEPWLPTPAAATFWPYMSTIWRLTGNAKAAWLDGDPPFFRHYDLPVEPGQLDSLAELLRRLHLMTHHPPEQSLRGGTQTQGHLFLRSESELQLIRTLILAAVRDYVDGLPAFTEGHPLLGTPRSALHFEGAWSVRLAAQGFHVVHTHPLGWISSAFYVAFPANMGPEKAGWLQLGAPPPDLRVDLAPYAEIEPKLGRLALFPSTLWHGTLPFADGERLTIAFDMRTPRR